MEEYVRGAAQKMGVTEDTLSVVKILSKALDLRNQEQFYYKMSLVISVDDSFSNKQKFTLYSKPETVENKTQSLILSKIFYKHSFCNNM